MSGLVVATCLICTIFKLRTPGMSLNRMPLFVWAMLVVSFMVIFAMPAIMISSTCLILDRLVSTHFYNQAEGGDPLLWQHLFWFFGHPEVYIIFLPALGMMSEIDRDLLAAAASSATSTMVLSMVATAFIGFGVWVHHMFATGLPQFGQSFFTAASIMIVVPTVAPDLRLDRDDLDGAAAADDDAVPLRGVVLLRLHHRRPDRRDARVGAARPPGPRHLLRGRALPLRADRRLDASRCSAALVYWFPKMTGRMLSERLGAASFWLLFVGFNLTFFPMHLLGLDGHAAAGLHLSRVDGLGRA